MSKIKLNSFYSQVRKEVKHLSKESIDYIYFLLVENDSNILEKSYKGNRAEYVGRNYYEVSTRQLEYLRGVAVSNDEVGYITTLKNGRHLMVAF